MSMWTISELGLKDTFLFKYYKYLSGRDGNKRNIESHNELHRKQ